MKSSAGHAVRSQTVDPRVAHSPLVSLRYHVDGWATDLGELVAIVERDMVRVAARRTSLMQQLRRNEEVRQHILNALSRYAIHDVVRCFHDGLAINAELGRVEEQAADLQRRHEMVAAEQQLFRTLAETLRHVAVTGGITLSERAGVLSQAARHIFQIVDEEHEALAGAVLDGPMQRLSDAAFEAELALRNLSLDKCTAAQHATGCRVAASDAARGVDRLIARLRPITPERTLCAALRELLVDSPIRENARLRIIGHERRLPALSELTIYRIVEEAVDNAVRHGHAAHIDVVLSFHSGRVVVVVKDDGDGFDVTGTEALLGRTRGLGLIQMQARAALVGSRLEVRSLIGAGTEVRVMLGQSP